jgi:hypothetical protein
VDYQEYKKVVVQLFRRSEKAGKNNQVGHLLRKVQRNDTHSKRLLVPKFVDEWRGRTGNLFHKAGGQILRFITIDLFYLLTLSFRTKQQT